MSVPLQGPLPHKPSRLRRFLLSYVQPLVFVIGFPLAFVSALHAPAPHDMPLLLVGPAAAVAGAADALDETDEFLVTHTDDIDAAQEAVAGRVVAGSIAITPQAAQSSAESLATFTVQTYVAGGGGAAAAAAVTRAGAALAEQFGSSSEVIDVAPLAEEDGTGTGLFFLLAYTTLGGYLVIISLLQFLPAAKLRTRYAAAGITAVAAPLVVFGISAIYMGDYGATMGQLLALWGVATLYVFTVSAITILIAQFLGKVATAGVLVVIVLLGFPGSGGTVPAAMLPAFWRFVHEVYFTSGGLEAFRSIIYFDGSGVGRWLLQLGAWTVGIVLVTLAVHLSRYVAAQGRRLQACQEERDRQPRFARQTFDSTLTTSDAHPLMDTAPTLQGDSR